MSQEITKDPFEFCDSPSPAPNDECNDNQMNNKLNLLLAKIERIDKNVLKLNQLVDMLISKETIMEMTLSSINTDYIHTREIVHKTETSCSKILNIIEERALSYERAIEDAAEQIQTITKKVSDRNFNQTDHIDENCTNLTTMVDNDNIYQNINLNNDECTTVREEI
ncbi:unnamed protein product [Rotaria sp. Silwood1]|nr:unnamed protein product [Rotaria sp. Silwood1]CAF1643838.1 unnamed protein product [Rotaria sp. Silwood1]